MLDEPIVFVSSLTRKQWHDRHRVDGRTHHTDLWVDSVREAISRSIIRDDGTRIYYYITMAEGNPGLALRREYFGCGAYMSRDDAEGLLVGELSAAGIMAHELGHCLSFHPGPLLANVPPPGRNVMSTGCRGFPNCDLNDEQRAVLSASPFISST